MQDWPEDYIKHAIAQCRSQGMMQAAESLQSLDSELGRIGLYDSCEKAHFSMGWLLSLAMRLEGQINDLHAHDPKA
jgi:hypothetical protein